MALKLSHFCKPRAALLSRAVSYARNRTSLLGSTYTIPEGEEQALACRCATSLPNRALRDSGFLLHVLGNARVQCLHARVCDSNVDQALWESAFGVFRPPGSSTAVVWSTLAVYRRPNAAICTWDGICGVQPARQSGTACFFKRLRRCGASRFGSRLRLSDHENQDGVHPIGFQARHGSCQMQVRRHYSGICLPVPRPPDNTPHAVISDRTLPSISALA